MNHGLNSGRVWIRSISRNTVASMIDPTDFPGLRPYLGRLLMTAAVAAAPLAVVQGAAAQEVGAAGVRPRQVRIVDPQAAAIGAGRLTRTGLPGSDDGFDLKAIRTTPVPAEVREIVAEFDSAEWTAREDASRRLEAHPAPDEALLRVLDQDELSEEQRQRLMSVIATRIINRPRGAIGIRMNTRPGFGGGAIEGVEVTQLIEGLPAERVLKVGDVISRIDERDIRNNSDLIDHVQRMSPGQVIQVRVMRPRAVAQEAAAGAGWIRDEGGRWFEPVEVEFALGSFEKLGDQQGGVNTETNRRQRLIIELRAIWDRRAAMLDGGITVDGIVPSDVGATPVLPLKPGLRGP